ncbi:hypothetical protein AX16_010017 [Volvariella volvacea WC 439]|nr:hypothetical protein AX16_010017 [Volvariella volvacea WC 439]
MNDPVSLPFTFTPSVADYRAADRIHEWSTQYSRVKAAELKFMPALPIEGNSSPISPTLNKTTFLLVAIRVLGCCMLEITSFEGLSRLSHAMQCSNDEEKLVILGKILLRYLVKLFFNSYRRQSREESPECASPLLFEHERSEFAGKPAQEMSHMGAKIRAFERDEHRCLATGEYDTGDRSSEPTAYFDVARQPGHTLHAAHIIPESLNYLMQSETDEFILDPASDSYERQVVEELGAEVLGCQSQTQTTKTGAQCPKMDTPSILHFMFGVFGYEDIIDQLHGERIYDTSNTLIVTNGMPEALGRLHTWFEETDTPNKYEVCATDSNSLPSKPASDHPYTFKRLSTAAFKGSSSLPVPSPHYLAFHALCARIGHRSGATWFLTHLDKMLGGVREGQSIESPPMEDSDVIYCAVQSGYMKRRSVKVVG